MFERLFGLEWELTYTILIHIHIQYFTKDAVNMFSSFCNFGSTQLLLPFFIFTRVRFNHKWSTDRRRPTTNATYDSSALRPQQRFGMSGYDRRPVSDKMSFSQLGIRQFPPQLSIALDYRCALQAQCLGRISTTYFNPSSYVSLEFSFLNHPKMSAKWKLPFFPPKAAKKERLISIQ